jgi:hypothetical protein
MKGYHVSNGYMGYVLGKGYQLFETEDAYYEWHHEAYPTLHLHRGGVRLSKIKPIVLKRRQRHRGGVDDCPGGRESGAASAQPLGLPIKTIVSEIITQYEHLIDIDLSGLEEEMNYEKAAFNTFARTGHCIPGTPCHSAGAYRSACSSS